MFVIRERIYAHPVYDAGNILHKTQKMVSNVTRFSRTLFHWNSLLD